MLRWNTQSGKGRCIVYLYSWQKYTWQQHLRFWLLAWAGWAILKILDGSLLAGSASASIGYRAGWSIALGLLFGPSVFVASLIPGLPLLTTLPQKVTYLVSYCLSYGVAIVIIRRWLRAHSVTAADLFTSRKGTGIFLLCTLGASTLSWFGFYITGVDVVVTDTIPGALSRILREAAGIVVLAPFLITYLEVPFGRFAGIFEPGTPRRLLQPVATRAAVIAALLCGLTFGFTVEFSVANKLHIVYLTFLPLLLATARYGARTSIPGLAISTVLVNTLWLLRWSDVYELADYRFLTFISGVLVLVITAILEERAADQNRLNRALENQIQLQNRLQHAQRMETLGRLAAGVAHDFNNYLTVINGCSQLAAAKVVDQPKVLANLERIQQAGTSAEELVHQLLAFSRKREAPLEQLDINEIIQSNRSMLSTLLGKRIVLHLELAPDLPPTYGARIGLVQILMNLASNAHHAAPSSGGRVHIRTMSSTLDDRPAIALEVEDNGRGIPVEILDQIFEPFFTTKESGEGTGMGLATVYGTVLQMGGVVTVRSTEGVGTTFRIELPVSQTPLPHPAPAQTAEAPRLFGRPGQ